MELPAGDWSQVCGFISFSLCCFAFGLVFCLSLLTLWFCLSLFSVLSLLFYFCLFAITSISAPDSLIIYKTWSWPSSKFGLCFLKHSLTLHFLKHLFHFDWKSFPLKDVSVITRDDTRRMKKKRMNSAYQLYSDSIPILLHHLVVLKDIVKDCKKWVVDFFPKISSIVSSN